MNMSRIAVLVLLFALPAVVSADDVEIKKVVKAKVEVLNEATVKGEFARIADLTHPKVVEIAGGREKMIALMEKSFKEMKEEGISVHSAKVGEPSDLARKGGDLYVVVPFDLTMKVEGGKITASGYVVGVSSDQGKVWTFVNSSSSPGAIKLILPDLPNSLELPEKRKPVFEKD